MPLRRQIPALQGCSQHDTLDRCRIMLPGPRDGRGLGRSARHRSCTVYEHWSTAIFMNPFNGVSSRDCDVWREMRPLYASSCKHGVNSSRDTRTRADRSKVNRLVPPKANADTLAYQND
jgi:hypothetical protein